MLCSSTNVGKAKPCEARKDIIISGFLMKSPPPPAKKSKSVIPVSLFPKFTTTTQNWKKRFCVLYKLRKPRQTEVYLHYFKDSDCKHFKGSVDLHSCHCIYEELETLDRQNIFGIKTMWMGEARTYLFSAETPEEMNQWLYRLGAALHMDTAVPGPNIPFTGSSPLAHFPTASRPQFPYLTASNRIQASNRVPQGYDLSTVSPWSAHSSSGRSQRPPPLQSIVC
ncbi:GPI-anchor transamidase subunit gab1 [Sparganum proliferum]